MSPHKWCGAATGRSRTKMRRERSVERMRHSALASVAVSPVAPRYAAIHVCALLRQQSTVYRPVTKWFRTAVLRAARASTTAAAA